MKARSFHEMYRIKYRSVFSVYFLYFKAIFSPLDVIINIYEKHQNVFNFSKFCNLHLSFARLSIVKISSIQNLDRIWMEDCVSQNNHIWFLTAFNDNFILLFYCILQLSFCFPFLSEFLKWQNKILCIHKMVLDPIVIP